MYTSNFKGYNPFIQEQPRTAQSNQKLSNTGQTQNNANYTASTPATSIFGPKSNRQQTPASSIFGPKTLNNPQTPVKSIFGNTVNQNSRQQVPMDKVNFQSLKQLQTPASQIFGGGKHQSGEKPYNNIYGNCPTPSNNIFGNCSSSNNAIKKTQIKYFFANDNTSSNVFGEPHGTHVFDTSNNNIFNKAIKVSNQKGILEQTNRVEHTYIDQQHRQDNQINSNDIYYERKDFYSFQKNFKIEKSQDMQQCNWGEEKIEGKSKQELRIEYLRNMVPLYEQKKDLLCQSKVNSMGNNDQSKLTSPYPQPEYKKIFQQTPNQFLQPLKQKPQLDERNNQKKTTHFFKDNEVQNTKIPEQLTIKMGKYETKAYVPNVQIKNQFGRILFLEPISLEGLQLKDCVQILQDEIQIKEISWFYKKCEIQFYNFAFYHLARSMNQRDKMLRKVFEMGRSIFLKYKKFDEKTGNLTMLRNCQTD